jgi:hypothetical protein
MCELQLPLPVLLLLLCFNLAALAANECSNCPLQPNSQGVLDVPFADWVAVFGTDGATNITIPTGAFSKCDDLKTLVIPEGVIEISVFAFANKYLESVTFSNTLLVLDHQAFTETNITEVDIPDSVTSIGKACFSETLLRKVTIGTSVRSVGEFAFANTYLSSLTFRSPSSLEFMGMSAFSPNLGKNPFIPELKALSSVQIPKSVTNMAEIVFQNVGLMSLTFESGSKLESIGDLAFSENYAIGTINLPSSLQRLGRAVFAMATNLKSVKINSPELGGTMGAAKGYIDRVFIACDSLQADDVLYNKSLWSISLGHVSSSVDIQLQGVNSTCPSGICNCNMGFGNTQPPNSGYFNCAPCARGEWSDAPSRMPCKKCAVGTYTDKTRSTKCLDCFPGTYCPNSGTIQYSVCPPGKYNDLINQGVCKLCPVGRYQHLEAAAVCTVCPAGKYNSIAGAEDENYCLSCLPGKFGSGNGLSACQPCGKDTYTDLFTSMVSCRTCPVGFTTNGVTPDGTGATYCIVDTSSCDNGYFRDSHGICKECDAGWYSSSGSECEECGASSFSARKSPKCTYCPRGKYGLESGNKTSETSACQECPLGSFNSFSGATICSQCAPGSSCPDTGLSVSKECEIGFYSDRKGSLACIKCPAGRYQSKKGEALCDACPRGKYNAFNGSVDASACRSCQAGRYSASAGSSVCTICTASEHQPKVGQYDCVQCTGKGQIGNADRTACMEDPAYTALAGPTVAEALFKNGTALIGAAIVTGIFLLVVGVMQYEKQAYGKSMATLPPFMVIVKASLTGFSYGSELFLVIGMLSNGPGFAALMILFRLAHVGVAAMLVTILFGPTWFPAWVEDNGWVKNARTLHTLLDESYCRAKMPHLVGVIMLSMLDCSLVQFLPWKASSVYEESKGFPCTSVMRWCLATDAVQATVSVLCQITFLSTSGGDDGADTNSQAKTLFALNITFAVMGNVAGMLMLFLKDTLMRRMGINKPSSSSSSSNSESDGDSQVQQQQRDEVPPSCSVDIQTAADVADVGLSLGSVYKDRSLEMMTSPSTMNPMMAAMERGGEPAVEGGEEGLRLD